MNNAVKGKTVAAMMCLALSTSLSIYPALLIAPLTLILADLNQSHLFLLVSCTAVASFSGMFYIVQYASFLWLGSWNFVQANYSIILLLTDLTPNVGLWWYFFTEMFEDFRNFFLSVFQLHLIIYVVPLCMKLR